MPALQGADPAVEQAVDKAIVQNKHFDAPTASVSNLRVYTWPKDDRRCEAWKGMRESIDLTIRIGGTDRQGRDQWDILRTPEDILQPAMFEMSRVFSDNRRTRDARNLKRGKLDGRALGKRAWKGDDDRLYKKRDRPKKRDYAVIVAGDCSWSQHLGKTMVVTKQAMFAQSELLHRMGIAFEVWAHTAEVGEAYMQARRKGNDDVEPDFEMVMNQIKGWTDPWNEKQQEGLSWLHAVETNLDGHNLEFLRKRLMMTDATDKILLYYTDGEMPAANYEDELEVLKREIETYKRLGIVLVGVGVGTDSPKSYGLDTVRIDNKGDIGKVVKHLEGELTRIHR
jgi:cobalamin biosynthesis protein CobT